MYKLTQTLPFMLYTLSNHVSGAFAIELAEHRLTIAMYRVMAALLEREDQRLGELSEMIFIEITTLSRLVGSMNRRGIVSRRRQVNDERSLRINLTAEGRALLERLIPRAQYYERLLTRNLDKQNIGTLGNILSLMLLNVSELRKMKMVEDKPAPVKSRSAVAIKKAGAA
jgi:MarR family transcriptional regulator, organic hydroperoxide resistance regulator